MAFVYHDRVPGGRILLYIKGIKEPVLITVLGESPDRPGQTRLAFDNVGGNAGVIVKREEDVKKTTGEYYVNFDKAR